MSEKPLRHLSYLKFSLRLVLKLCNYFQKLCNNCPLIGDDICSKNMDCFFILL